MHYDSNTVTGIPLGPNVTPTASASLLMPACIRLRESLSKIISLASARVTCGAPVFAPDYLVNGSGLYIQSRKQAPVAGSRHW